MSSVLLLDLSSIAYLCLIVAILISAYAGGTINELKEEVERLKQAQLIQSLNPPRN